MLSKSGGWRIRLADMLALLLHASLRLLKRSSRIGIEIFLVTARLKSMIFWYYQLFRCERRIMISRVLSSDEIQQRKVAKEDWPKITLMEISWRQKSGAF